MDEHPTLATFLSVMHTRQGPGMEFTQKDYEPGGVATHVDNETLDTLEGQHAILEWKEKHDIDSLKVQQRSMRRTIRRLRREAAPQATIDKANTMVMTYGADIDNAMQTLAAAKIKLKKDKKQREKDRKKALKKRKKELRKLDAKAAAGGGRKPPYAGH